MEGKSTLFSRPLIFVKKGTRKGSKKGQKQEILLRTAQNRPKTDKRESHTDMTELFCDKNPKTFQVFAGAE